MEPQTPTPEIGPVPNEERLPAPIIAPETIPLQNVEKAPDRREIDPQIAKDYASQNAGAPAIFAPPAPQVADGAASPVPADAAVLPDVATDSDLIEKQWVRIAKKVIEETKDDPYQQNQKITKVKVGYIKKRYNKDIGIAED